MHPLRAIIHCLENTKLGPRIIVCIFYGGIGRPPDINPFINVYYHCFLCALWKLCTWSAKVQRLMVGGSVLL